MSGSTIRNLFANFTHQQANDLIYFDSAATSLKLISVISATEKYYQVNTTNVHRSSYKVAEQVTQQFEQSRRDVQQFINAKSEQEIIWTKGATDSLNLLATCLGKINFFDPCRNEIIIAASEHHSNIVPWQELAQRLGLIIKVMPVNSKGVLDLAQSLPLITNKTALVAVAHVSNALGNINPIQDLIQQAKLFGALTVIDGTQAVAHMPIDVQKLDCDFYIFSGHKMFGPTGIGILYGKLDLLNKLPPYQYGGEMVKTVSFNQGATYQASPLKFEAGTPNIAGVLGLSEAIKFIQTNSHLITSIEADLYQELLRILTDIPEVILWGDTSNSISLQAFTVKGLNPYDLAVLLDQHNIALRVGHHCAMPLFEALAIDGVLRVSLACYNTQYELQLFAIALKNSIASLLNHDQETLTVESAEQQTDKVHLGSIAQKVMIAKGWDNTYRQLMLAGKNLNRLNEQDKTSDTQVFGCESQVWIKCELVNGQLVLQGDSASKIVRGLLAVIFEALDNRDISQIIGFDLQEYLSHLGLSRHLSESRGNGLAAVFKKIVAFCELKLPPIRS
ncbi:aminotransferase class V-fold PLP-dependent enzyme [Paraglaciecola sp. L3A3]|uniref:aminotransferase class V-fold PLP-dependent enzyme n=1 Tax=Paraglaciecola sp. L3A3 TaxID=2686358 RepID=UPI00131DE58B|nr:aminotransferase class V-fold PLP-dependent enzyme [Paraglaciecola sp. L3A3]